MSVYRTASPPPPEPIVIADGSNLYIVNAHILMECNGCGATWLLHDTFTSEDYALRYLQSAWAHRHLRCK